MRRRKKKEIAHWGWRLGGLVLCVFFALGMAAGVSVPGRSLAARVRSSLESARARIFAGSDSLFHPGDEPLEHVTGRASSHNGAVAIVERWNGFYALAEQGGLRGPISPEALGDLPVLSGPAIQSARVDQLLDFASVLVRAEAALSVLVSEMRVDNDGIATLFLEGSHTQLAIDADLAPLELRRASEVLKRWRGHDQLVAALDMTTPGEAIMRIRGVQSFSDGDAHSSNFIHGHSRARLVADRARESRSR
ncbi:MAG: hypothetical protein ACREP6_08880 [Candidatus Binataceae bacterium]